MTAQDRLPPEGVLVVEDDPDILRAVVQVLQDEGYVVRAAVNGRVALELLRDTDIPPPRLILLDLMMPVMDGWTFRAEQLADPAIAAIPVIILTADGNAADKAHRLGGVNALRKPVDLNTLLDAVEPYLS
jgi:CheY-like chemotaxis protein